MQREHKHEARRVINAQASDGLKDVICPKRDLNPHDINQQILSLLDQYISLFLFLILGTLSHRIVTG